MESAPQVSFAARARQQIATALEAFLRPVLVALVVLLDRGHIRRKHDPELLRRSEDVDIGRQAIRLIERPNADEAHDIAPAAVVAPQGDTASRAAGDLLSLSAVRGSVHHLRLALQQDHAVGFNHGVQREGRPGFTLAPAAMTTVNEHRLAGHPVAHCTAGAVALQRERSIVSHQASFPFKPPDHSAALVDDEYRMPARIGERLSLRRVGLCEIHAYMPLALRSCSGEGARCRGIALAFDLALSYLDRPISIESRSPWSPGGKNCRNNHRPVV